MLSSVIFCPVHGFQDNSQKLKSINKIKNLIPITFIQKTVIFGIFEKFMSKNC